MQDFGASFQKANASLERCGSNNQTAFIVAVCPISRTSTCNNLVAAGRRAQVLREHYGARALRGSSARPSHLSLPPSARSLKLSLCREASLLLQQVTLRSAELFSILHS